MGISRGKKIATNGLVMYLDAANKSSYVGSGTTWADLTGNGYNITLTDEVIGTRNPGRMTFSSSSLEYGSIAGGYALGTSSNSINIWTMCTDENLFAQSYGLSGHIIGYNNKFLGALWWRYISGYQVTGLGIYTETFTNGNQLVSATNQWDFYLNQMYNIHININNGTGSFYVNGEFRSDNARPTNILDLDYIGAIPQATYADQQRLDGQINSIAVWDRPLSDSEILQNYNAVKDRFGL